MTNLYNTYAIPGVEDNLISTSTADALSANMGRVLSLRDDTMVANSRAEAKAVDHTIINAVYLNEGIRSGWFAVVEGDFSAAVTADTEEALYLAIDGELTTERALVRNVDYYNFEMAGVVAGNSTSGADCTPAYNSWLAMSKLGVAPPRLLIKGTKNNAAYYWFNTEPDDIQEAVVVQGAGFLNIFVKNFVSSADRKGIFNLYDGGAGCSFYDFSISSAAGSSASGCLMSAVAGSNGSPSQAHVQNVVMSVLGGGSSHRYTFYFDGAAQAGFGIDSWCLTNVLIYAATVANMFIRSAVSFMMHSAGIYLAGGAATSYVDITGIAGTLSEQVILRLGAIAPDIFVTNCNDCSIIVGYHAGDLNNNATCTNFYGRGRRSASTTLANFWVTSRWEDPSTGVVQCSGDMAYVLYTDGTNIPFEVESINNNVIMRTLPTSVQGVPGVLWNDNGTVKVS